MKLKLHTLHVSYGTVLSLGVKHNTKNKLTKEAYEKLEGRPLYSKIQYSFLNLYEDSKFKKL